MRHRGPDGRRLWWTPNAALGHARLSIIDLTESAAQPVRSPDGHLRIVFNGEILNYAELAGELSRLGHEFRGRGDTEVLLAAYSQWGAGCLSRLRGMFAFAVHDARDGSLFLARDAFGIKPLYYVVTSRAFAFASEPKALFDVLDEDLRLDLESVSAFLSLRHVPAPATLFSQVKQLVPGSWLTVRRGVVEERSWYSLPRRPRLRRLGRGLGARALRARVDAAVDAWSTADVPIGLYLSGGLDSSALASSLATQKRPFETYCADYALDGYAESDYANSVTAFLAIPPPNVVGVTADVSLPELKRLISLRDHPLGMHNEVALAQLASVASRRSRVILCGEGADELFAGYGRLFRLPFEIRKKKPQGARWAWERHVSSVEFRAFMVEYSYLPLHVKHSLFSPSVRDALDDDKALLSLLSKVWDRSETEGFHDRIIDFLLSVHLPGLLQVLDASGMSSGVECRFPFLDGAVVSHARALGERSKLRWRSPKDRRAARHESPQQYSEIRDETKVILRRAFRNSLPIRTLARKKVPFSAPLNEWFASPAAAEVADLLLGEGARVHSIFDPARLRRWWDARGNDDPTFGRQAWMILNLEMWLQIYFPRGIAVVDDARSALDSEGGGHGKKALQSRSDQHT